MIKSWHKFNESQSSGLTKEMAQEIIYYISEDSTPTKSIFADIYNAIGNHNDDFTMYETGYEDIKEMIKKLLSMCQNNPELTDKMIQIYHKIREEREIFPEAFEIEEIFSDFMDLEDFNFMIYSTESEYKIRLSKSDVKNMDSFIKYCQEIRDYLIRLESPDYRTKLSRCEFLNDYNINDIEYGWIYFEVRLKKI